MDLYNAIYSGDYLLVDSLIHRGKDVNQRWCNRYPIEVAVRNHNMRICKMLLANGAYLPYKRFKIKKDIMFFHEHILDRFLKKHMLRQYFSKYVLPCIYFMPNSSGYYDSYEEFQRISCHCS